MAAPLPEGFTTAGQDFTVLNRQCGNRAGVNGFGVSGYKAGDPFCGPAPSYDAEEPDSTAEMED